MVNFYFLGHENRSSHLDFGIPLVPDGLVDLLLVQDDSVLIFDEIQLLLDPVELHLRIRKLLDLSVHSRVVLFDLVLESLH